VRKTRPAMIGLFVIGAIIITIGGVLALGGARWFKPSGTAILYFEESVGGLSAGSGVNFRGVRIGEVERVSLEIDGENADAIIPVRIRISPGGLFDNMQADSIEEALDRWIDQGLSGQLHSQNLLTGQLSIKLDFRPDANARLRDRQTMEPQIPVVASEVEQFREALTEIDWRAMVGQVEDTLTAMTGLATTLQDELSGAGESMSRTATATETLVDEVRVSLRTLSESTETSLQAFTDLNQDASASLNRLESQISESMTSIERLINHTEENLGARGDELSRVLSQTESTMVNIEQVTEQLSTLTHPRSAERDDLQRALRDLASAGATLRRFANMLENNPNMLFFGTQEDQP